MPDWFVVVETATGRPRSFGTVISDPLRPGLESIALAGPPDYDNEMWDEETKSFVPRPPKVFVNRVDDDLFGHPSFQNFIDLMSILTPPQRATVKNAIKRLLGTALIRVEREPIEIGRDEDA